jgi:hypothetical protein
VNDTNPGLLWRALEWIAALAGAITCVAVPLVFLQPDRADFPLPGLYFVEIALTGVGVLVVVAFRSRLSSRWEIVPWVAAGIVLAFVVLGGFSIGPYLIPALIAFLAVGVLIGWQTGRLHVGYLGYWLTAAIMQAALMLLAVQFV